MVYVTVASPFSASFLRLPTWSPSLVAIPPSTAFSASYLCTPLPAQKGPNLLAAVPFIYAPSYAAYSVSAAYCQLSYTVTDSSVVAEMVSNSL